MKRELAAKTLSKKWNVPWQLIASIPQEHLAAFGSGHTRVNVMDLINAGRLYLPGNLGEQQHRVVEQIPARFVLFGIQFLVKPDQALLKGLACFRPIKIVVAGQVIHGKIPDVAEILQRLANYFPGANRFFKIGHK